VACIAGLFVGGKGSRMGGAAKGLLPAPGGRPIVLRTRSIVEAVGGVSVLVGAHPAYAELGLSVLPDDSAATGPLAGLLALLQFTWLTLGESGRALAIACDMPHLTTDLIHRLLAASSSAVVAPRRHHPERGWLWEPLIARYDPGAVLPGARAFAARGGTRLQSLLDELGASALPPELGDAAALVDWDTPADTVREGTT
jgi:molybdopterin-guanine dinucleotide biosynthesis protein A